jgi:hypothetical protein
MNVGAPDEGEPSGKSFGSAGFITKSRRQEHALKAMNPII